MDVSEERQPWPRAWLGRTALPRGTDLGRGGWSCPGAEPRFGRRLGEGRLRKAACCGSRSDAGAAAGSPCPVPSEGAQRPGAVTRAQAPQSRQPAAPGTWCEVSGCGLVLCWGALSLSKLFTSARGAFCSRRSEGATEEEFTNLEAPRYLGFSVGPAPLVVSASHGPAAWPGPCSCARGRDFRSLSDSAACPVLFKGRWL